MSFEDFFWAVTSVAHFISFTKEAIKARVIDVQIINIVVFVFVVVVVIFIITCSLAFSAKNASRSKLCLRLAKRFGVYRLIH